MYLFLLILLALFPSEDKIIIKDSWIRPSSKNMATALYLKIENKSVISDTLYQVDCDFAGKVEIHETYSEGDMMGMRKVDLIVVKGESTFQFKPGSYHIMLMKLKKDINDGDEEEFTFHFKRAGEIKITAIAKKPK